MVGLGEKNEKTCSCADGLNNHRLEVWLHKHRAVRLHFSDILHKLTNL